MEIVKEIIENPTKIANYIEHTNVKVESTKKDIENLCKEVLKYNFYGAVVLPYHVKLARKILKNKAKVITVIGFPYGIQSTRAKVAEVEDVFEYVDEFDMVFNRNAFLNKDYKLVVKDIKSVVNAAKPKVVKVIIETPSLTKEQIKIASKLVIRGNAHFVKTAVGYSGAAKVEDVKIIKRVVGDKIKIKASGGIKDFNQALEMIKAGADRIGSSHGVDIIKTSQKI
ncbi:MAG: deoxyribose-phosphate aldolase [Candidatus Aenigmarchaeota archaeon]|nr:deoxyribose-phosphate aldolase [Candidatus Aenigmarchaeota archaeon]